MNEIVTPPGYVEYPRDPKFRPASDLDRLELMGVGCVQFGFSYWLIVGMVLNWATDYESAQWIRLALGTFLAGCLSICAWAGLRKILRAKGRPEVWAIWIALLLDALSEGLAQKSMPALPLTCILAAVEIGLGAAIWHYVAPDFKKYGLRIPIDLDERKFRKQIAGVRSKAEQEAKINLNSALIVQSAQEDR